MQLVAAVGKHWPSSKASIFRRGQSFQVTWFGEPFVLDRLPKSIDREGLGESRTGTRAVSSRLVDKQYVCYDSEILHAKKFGRLIFGPFLFHFGRIRTLLKHN